MTEKERQDAILRLAKTSEYQVLRDFLVDRLASAFVAAIDSIGDNAKMTAFLADAKATMSLFEVFDGAAADKARATKEAARALAAEPDLQEGDPVLDGGIRSWMDGDEEVFGRGPEPRSPITL